MPKRNRTDTGTPQAKPDDLLAAAGVGKRQVWSKLNQSAGELILEAALELHVKLNDLPRWSQLAGDKKEFDQELGRVFDLIRKVYYLAFDISPGPRHRPARHRERDKRIYQERIDHPGRSFAVIGRRFKLSPTATAEAYRREEGRRTSAINRLRAILADLPSGQPFTSSPRTPEGGSSGA